MSQTAELRAVVAEFLEVDASAIDAETELGGPRFSSSLARAGLDAALRRRLGIKCSAVYTARRFRDLEAAVLGEEPSSEQPPETEDPESARSRGRHTEGLHAHAWRDPPTDPSSGARTVSCGVDIQDVDALPDAADYWEHELYKHSFTAAEIAYCSAQANAREHFAARWAAKEAVKKVAPEYLHCDPADLEVFRAESGAPGLKLRGRILPVALSLSHTSSFAIAMVVTMPHTAPSETAGLAAPAAPPLPQSAPYAAPAPGRSRFAAIVPLVAILALGAALWALLRTFG